MIHRLRIGLVSTVVLAGCCQVFGFLPFPADAVHLARAEVSARLPDHQARHIAEARITAVDFTCRSEDDSTIDVQHSEAESGGPHECRSPTSFVSLSFDQREGRTVFEVHEIGNPCGPSSDFEAVWEQLSEVLVQEHGGSSVSLELPRSPADSVRSPAPATREVDLDHLFEGIPSGDATFVLLDGDDGSLTRYHPARARKRFLPASTYKIPNTLIALETGVAPDADFELAWDEDLRPDTGFWARSWSQDHTLRSALRHSVYWYYQELARRIGGRRMQLYLDRFEYGNRSMGGGLDRFWLHGDLRISADEQVQFLRRWWAGELGVSGRSTEILKDLLVLESHGEVRLSGKTGTVDVTPGRELAWLVGYVEREESVYFFALNVEGEEVWERWGPPEKRLALVRAILRSLSVLPEAESRASGQDGRSPGGDDDRRLGLVGVVASADPARHASGLELPVMPDRGSLPQQDGSAV